MITITNTIAIAIITISPGENVYTYAHNQWEIPMEILSRRSALPKI
jgi:hypothetical protein